MPFSESCHRLIGNLAQRAWIVKGSLNNRVGTAEGCSESILGTHLVNAQPGAAMQQLRRLPPKKWQIDECTLSDST